MVRFTTGEGAWVASLDDVVEVRPASVVRSLPAPTDGVAGIVDHEGTAIPVLRVLGAGDRHVLVVRAGSAVAGVLVEEVTGVVEVDGVGPAPGGQRTALVAGTVREGDELAYVLAVGQLVAAAQQENTP